MFFPMFQSQGRVFLGKNYTFSIQVDRKSAAENMEGGGGEKGRWGEEREKKERINCRESIWMAGFSL